MNETVKDLIKPEAVLVFPVLINVINLTSMQDLTLSPERSQWAKV
jgi:hypothetical protein